MSPSRMQHPSPLVTGIPQFKKTQHTQIQLVLPVVEPYGNPGLPLITRLLQHPSCLPGRPWMLQLP